METAFESAISSKRASAYLGVSPETLRSWRFRAIGPPCHYSGTMPVYYLSELRQWQDECTAAIRAKQERRKNGTKVAASA